MSVLYHLTVLASCTRQLLDVRTPSRRTDPIAPYACVSTHVAKRTPIASRDVSAPRVVLPPSLPHVRRAGFMICLIFSATNKGRAMATVSLQTSFLRSTNASSALSGTQLKVNPWLFLLLSFGLSRDSDSCALGFKRTFGFCLSPCSGCHGSLLASFLPFWCSSLLFCAQNVPRASSRVVCRKPGIHPKIHEESKVYCNGELVLVTNGVKEEYVVDVWSGAPSFPFRKVHAHGSFCLSTGDSKHVF